MCYTQNGLALLERTVSTTDFYASAPGFLTVDNTHTQAFTFENFQNDLNNYYGTVSYMTKIKPLINNIDIFTPSSFLLSAPFYQGIGLENFGISDLKNIITPFASTVIASSILNHYGFTYWQLGRSITL